MALCEALEASESANGTCWRQALEDFRGHCKRSGSFRLSLDIECDCQIDFCKLPTCQTLTNLTPVKKLEY